MRTRLSICRRKARFPTREEALAAGIVVRPLSRYFESTAVQQGLLLGFAAVPIEGMDAPFGRLQRCMEPMRR